MMNTAPSNDPVFYAPRFTDKGLEDIGGLIDKYHPEISAEQTTTLLDEVALAKQYGQMHMRSQTLGAVVVLEDEWFL